MHRNRGTGRDRTGRVEQDCADHLVAQDQWFPEREGADRTVPVVVQVGPADTTVGNPDLHLPGRRLPRGQLVDPQVTGTMDNQRLHQTTAVIPPSINNTWPLT
jgi:hypothetical protein